MFLRNSTKFVTEADKKWLHGKGPQFCGFLRNYNKKIDFYSNGNNFVTEAEKMGLHEEGIKFCGAYIE